MYYKSWHQKSIYIEPYYKSKTEDFYTSFITLKEDAFQLLTFEGIDPRLFLYWNVKVEEEKELEQDISCDDSKTSSIDDYRNRQHKII